MFRTTSRHRSASSGSILRRGAVVGAVTAFVLGSTMTPVQAKSIGGPALNCGTQYAYTTSKSAGVTTHRQGVGGVFKTRVFNNPAPTAKDPYRTWSQGVRFLSSPGWEVQATVLESASAGCVRAG